MEKEKYPTECILLMNDGPFDKLYSMVAGGKVRLLPISHFP